MKTIYILLLFCFIILQFNTSCEKAIRVKMPNNQVGTTDVFKDVSTAKAALAALYSTFRDNSMFSGKSSGLGTVLALYTDELTSFSDVNSSTGDYDIFNNSIKSNNLTINSLWNSSYRNIYAINAFIEGVQLSDDLLQKDKVAFVGQAMLIRAIYYQYLAQLFGDVPLVKTTDYTFNKSIKKSPYNEVLLFVESELEMCMNSLDYNFQKPSRIYPNKLVAELLLAKNYLLQKRYDLAQSVSSSITSNRLVDLEMDVDKVFKSNSRSTIWQLLPSNTGLATWEAQNYYFEKAPPINHALNSHLIQVFSTDDLRFKSWIKEVGEGVNRFYHSYKYRARSNNNDECSIVFRVEEAYFVLIESLIYQGKTPEAVGYLNMIRNRAKLPVLSLTLNEEECLDAMLLESYREFFTEYGHRFFDLKRNGRLQSLKMLKTNWLDYHKLLPYPEKEIWMNNNMLPQNDGY